jgi:hypothetical protein
VLLFGHDVLPDGFILGRGKGEGGREKGEGRRGKGEGGREKGEGRRGKGEGRREKGEGRYAASQLGDR